MCQRQVVSLRRKFCQQSVIHRELVFRSMSARVSIRNFQRDFHPLRCGRKLREKTFRFSNHHIGFRVPAIHPNQPRAQRRQFSRIRKIAFELCDKLRRARSVKVGNRSLLLLREIVLR